MMKSVKVAFVDFWDGFEADNNFILDILRKHYNVEIIKEVHRKNEVQYLFYSCMGKEHLQYQCIRIFFTGENFVPDFNICDYAMGFEHMEIGDRYLRYPLYCANYPEDCQRMMEKNTDNIGTDKKFCSFVVSQSNIANPIREEFFYKLSEYRKVDSGGRFLNNIGMPQGVPDKHEFQKQYKFCIAFENASYPGYCTEKIVQAFAAGAVPIYWGDPQVNKYFNEKAFINCLAYDSMEEVIERVIELDQNDELYHQVRMEAAIEDPTESVEAYEQKLEQWLVHIFDQNLEKAQRVNKYGKQLLHLREQLFEQQVMQKYGPIERDEVHTLKDWFIRKLRLLKR